MTNADVVMYFPRHGGVPTHINPRSRPAGLPPPLSPLAALCPPPPIRPLRSTLLHTLVAIRPAPAQQVAASRGGTGPAAQRFGILRERCASGESCLAPARSPSCPASSRLHIRLAAFIPPPTVPFQPCPHPSALRTRPHHSD